MILGKCPYCKSDVIAKKMLVNGKNIKVYTCTNAKKEYDDSEAYVFTADSTCTFRVYSNAFLRWNKRSFGTNEMKKLLQDGQVKIRLYSKQKKDEYFKYAIPHKEYGISILWEEEVV